MGCDGFEGSDVHHVLALGSVEVNDMQATQTQVLELLSHFQRVAIDLLRVVVAFGEAHALAFDDVYCGNQFHLQFDDLQFTIYST